MLQKYDLERDELQRKWQAAVWGAEFKDDTSKTRKPLPSNGRKQTMRKEDIMQKYGNNG